MGAIEIRIEGDTRVARILEKMPALIGKKARKVKQEQAQALRRNVQMHIQRQGLVETGGYLRSITVLDGSVTTERPDATRHEYGFVGVDALGRHYDSPPRPHWRPSIEMVKRSFPKAILKEIESIGD